MMGPAVGALNQGAPAAAAVSRESLIRRTAARARPDGPFAVRTVPLIAEIGHMVALGIRAISEISAHRCSLLNSAILHI